MDKQYYKFVIGGGLVYIKNMAEAELNKKMIEYNNKGYSTNLNKHNYVIMKKDSQLRLF